MPRTLSVAAAQYPLDNTVSLTAYRAKITRWAEQAVRDGAQVLVFPEYAAMELAGLNTQGADALQSLEAVSDLTQEIVTLHAALSRRLGVMLVAGSGPCRAENGLYNIAQIFGPNGAQDHFTKIMPTPGERDPWHIKGGEVLKVYDIGIAKVGVLICYDIEFPLLSRALAEAGAEIIVAPSNTETLWGYWRVRHGAQARALENQIYTVQSPCVGTASFCKAVENNVGAAGVFGPPDRSLPHDGVIALGEMNAPQWLHAEVNLDLTAEIRHAGSVRTFAHWQEQPGAAALPAARMVDLKGTT